MRGTLCATGLPLRDGGIMTPETSIYEFAKQGVAISPNKTAIWFYGKRITYRELFRRIDNVADNLYALGVRQGTVVTIHLPNCPQAVMAIYAVAKLGGICSMVHALTPPKGLWENMAFTQSTFLITHRADCVQAGKMALLVDISHHMGLAVRLGYRVKNRGIFSAKVLTFEEQEKEAPQKAPFLQQKQFAGECAVYLHSSGTTGRPKTILLSHSALNHCAGNTADFFEKGDMQKQVSLGVLPLFHGFGLAMDVHRNLSFGSQLVLLPRWNARTAVKLIKKHKVTLIVGVPTMFYALLQEPGFCGPKIMQLSKCYVGGDNVKPELIDAFDRRVGGKRCMFTGFGLTEATTTNCVNTYLHDKKHSSGYPVRNTRIAVMDEAGNLRPSGEGELVISSKTLMLGYLNDPEATEHVIFQADGRSWVRTGDQVTIDEEGYLFFQSRLKNIIIHNGYNIYPEEVEDVIRKVPGVSQVCVVGITDEKLQTQNIRAVIVTEFGYKQDVVEAAVREECLRVLPRYAVPQQVRFLQSLPQNAMGKIDRKELSRP